MVANVDARVHAEPGVWPGLLSAQLCSPVRWRQTLGALDELGTAAVVEVGLGGVLTGLARRSLPGARSLAIAAPDHIHALVDAISGSGSWQAYAGAHRASTSPPPSGWRCRPAPGSSGPMRRSTPRGRATQRDARRHQQVVTTWSQMLGEVAPPSTRVGGVWGDVHASGQEDNRHAQPTTAIAPSTR